MTAYQNQNTHEKEDEYNLDTEKERITEGVEQIKKELLAKWEEIHAHAQVFPNTVRQINPPVIDFLLSYENTLFYNQLATKFSLTPEQRDALPKIVWQTCLNKNWDDLENLVSSKLDTTQIKELSEELEKNILSSAKDLSEKPIYSKKFSFETSDQPQTEKLSIAIALEKYPELSDQLITTKRIQLPNNPTLVRPSIKNWLADYTFNIGVSNRDSAIRGNYLFKNTNARQLSTQEREKLALILKSFEERTPLTINTKINQIVFPSNPAGQTKIPKASIPVATPNTVYGNKLETTPVQKNIPASFQSDSDRLSAWRKDLPQKETLEKTPSVPPINKIHFSSPQTFSTEKNILSSARKNTQISQNNPIATPKTNTNQVNPRQIPRNVINLKEK